MMTSLLQLRVLVIVVVVFLTSAVTGLSVNVELDLESVAGSCLGGETLGLTNTSVLVEYRLIATTTAWRFLAEVNFSQGFDQNLSLDIEVPVDSHGFQLKLLQREHGGGGCNCWRVASLALSNCSNGSYSDSVPCSMEGNTSSGSFCSDSARKPRGMITTAFYCPKLSSDKCPGDSDRLDPLKGSVLPLNCDEMSPRM